MDLKSLTDTGKKGEVDFILFVVLFILAGAGVAMTYSASAVYANNIYGDSLYFLKKQVLWFCLGFVTLFIFSEIDYRIYLKHTRIILFISLILLIMVLIPGIGKSAKGSVRWLGFGSFRIQPSEFVKVFMVIYLSKVFSFGTGMKNRIFQLLIPIVIIAVMFILIMVQPDFGTAMDLLIVSVIIIFVSGFPLSYILSLFVVSIPMFYLLVYHVDYRKGRVLAYLDPWKERFGSGYHIIQSFIAFKKGGLFGTGLGFGTQKIARLPEPHTDFVFAVIAEESGLFGTLLILLLYGLIFWRGMLISLKTQDEFGSLLAIGLTLLIVIQAFINIGVVIGSLPTTGKSLPLISYGGSSLISSMIAMGILLNISKYRVEENYMMQLGNGEA